MKNYATIEINNTLPSVGRTCQICEKGTNSEYDYICEECRKRLKNILYDNQYFNKE